LILVQQVVIFAGLSQILKTKEEHGNARRDDTPGGEAKI